MSVTPDPREIYRHHPDRYDALVRAEDAEANLPAAIAAIAPLANARVVEVGAGTGRVTRLLLEAGAHSVIASDRERAMIGLARRSLSASAGRTAFCVADAARLPYRDGVADVGIAGWVFGHLRYWLPESWRASIGTALDELGRAVRKGGTIIVIETLGTCSEVPQPPAPELAEYYAWLERERGFTRASVRTDFRFASADEAARAIEFFFGDALAEDVRRRGSAVVPECTGIWSRRVPE